MDSPISYTPPATDALSTSTTPAMRRSPLRLFFQDAGVLFTMLPYFPWIFLPFKTKDETAELYLNRQNAKEMMLQGILFLLELFFLLLFLPALLILPGLVSFLIAGIAFLLIYLIAWPMEGSSVTRSRMDKNTQRSAEQHRDERWIFVNGCASGHAGLQANIDRLAQIFGRAVTGIHNKTYGIVADVLECLIQRVFSYETADVRVAYEQIKAVLLDHTVTKVVLIGHSQGGIILSLVLDRLFTELSPSHMSKLEVYTFGSAASHFSNPRRSPSAFTDSNESEPGAPCHVISHIEHYANEHDMVPRWGVLHCTRDILSNCYAGAVFVRMGASGHMFNQHYLNTMFPSFSGVVQKRKRHLIDIGDLSPVLDSFLDQKVSVDLTTLLKRRDTEREAAGILGSESELEFGDGEIVHSHCDSNDRPNGGPSGEGDQTMWFGRTNSGKLLGEEARGKTVRELSRLWRYQGGESPL